MTGKNRHFRDLSQQVLSGVVASVSERFNSTRKLKKKKQTKKSSLKTVNHHRERIYISFKLDLSEFTEVVQWTEA